MRAWLTRGGPYHPPTRAAQSLAAPSSIAKVVRRPSRPASAYSTGVAAREPFPGEALRREGGAERPGEVVAALAPVQARAREGAATAPQRRDVQAELPQPFLS
jgi:hypothetical protein